jgi:RimJ/RimL family protein N-acetyltransferase
MEFLGEPQSRDEVEAMINRQRMHQQMLGYCFWAIELRTTRQMIGFCGIQPGPTGTPVFDNPEIGWRLAHEHWGKSYAREAAETAIDWFWRNTTNDIVTAITVHNNIRSWGLMERLRMTRHAELDFDHPNVPDDSALKRHITYSIGRNS